MLTDKIQLESGEEIRMRTRKHWFIIAIQAFSIAVMSVAPFVLLAWALASDRFPRFEMLIENETTLVSFLAGTWLLVMWMNLATAWVDYYLDVWILTNRRLISIDQRGLFRRHIGSFRLERLQDVNVEINGIVATFLDFGTVEAQTAGGNEEEFRARTLPHPRELKALILKTTDELIDGYRARPRLVGEDGEGVERT